MMDGKLKLNDNRIIDISLSDDNFLFLEQYLFPYYLIEKNKIEGNYTVARRLIEMKNDFFDSEIKEIEEKGELFRIDIHYNQKACVFQYKDFYLIQYEEIGHCLLVKENYIYIFLNKADKNYRYIPMRIVRDIIYADLLSDMFCEVHAASVSINGNGILIMGEGGAGKTTLLFRMLQNSNVDFVSNDKSFLNINTMEMLGYPVSVNILKDIVQFVPCFKKLFENGTESTHYQHIEWEEYKKRDKRTFVIKELQDLMGFKVKPSSTCKVILIPEKEKGEFAESDSDYSLLCKNIRRSKFMQWISILYGEEIKPYKIAKPKNDVVTFIKVYRDCDISNLIKYIGKRVKL